MIRIDNIYAPWVTELQRGLYLWLTATMTGPWAVCWTKGESEFRVAYSNKTDHDALLFVFREKLPEGVYLELEPYDVVRGMTITYDWNWEGFAASGVGLAALIAALFTAMGRLP